MNALFGLELPTAVNFVIAFVVVLALIGAATWLVRRFGAARLDAGGRNRQPRLAVIDSAAVDGRRKLVIIRRDNVEHLLMIGGPTDVVVETNIVRSGAAVAREAPAVRVNGGETLPRAMPLPDATHWPVQPEPAVPAPPAPATRPERVRSDDAAQWPTQSEPPPPPAAAPPVRAQRDALAGLAADLSQQTAAPAATPRPAAPVRAVATAKPAPAPQIDPQTAAANDQNLANMAHQLEAALRRPAQQAEPAKPPEQKRIEPKLVQRIEPAPRPAPKPAAAVAAASAAPAAAQQKQPFDSLEQEMASLLGRTGKP
jgi:flagellar biogenesis protein FliO